MITYEEYVNLRVVNDEKIAGLESSLGEKIPRDLLQKAIESHNAEEFMRPYYCKELQFNITNILTHVLYSFINFVFIILNLL